MDITSPTATATTIVHPRNIPRRPLFLPTPCPFFATFPVSRFFAPSPSLLISRSFHHAPQLSLFLFAFSRRPFPVPVRFLSSSPFSRGALSSFRQHHHHHHRTAPPALPPPPPLLPRYSPFLRVLLSSPFRVVNSNFMAAREVDAPGVHIRGRIVCSQKLHRSFRGLECDYWCQPEPIDSNKFYPAVRGI